jgi:hypothetical protein
LVRPGPLAGSRPLGHLAPLDKSPLKSDVANLSPTSGRCFAN